MTESAYRTPRPWPEGTEATPQQVLDWLRVCTDDEGMTALAVLIGAGERAGRCFVLDHDGEVERLREWQRRVVRVLREHGIDLPGSGAEAS